MSADIIFLGPIFLQPKFHGVLENFCIPSFRHINTISPAESSATSPVRLKRYEGFEGGLNVMGRSQRNSTHNLRNKSPPVKKSKRKETLENLGINFGQPSTPNEKKSSNESNPERFIFLGKIFRQNEWCLINLVKEPFSKRAKMSCFSIFVECVPILDFSRALLFCPFFGRFFQWR